MPSYVVRVWLPDRPGALGQIASRIGAVRGDVVGIEILERGAGRAIDELVVLLPDDGLVELLAAEIAQVDGVDVEDVRPIADPNHDFLVDALDTAARLVEATDAGLLLEQLVTDVERVFDTDFAAVIASGEHPPLAVVGTAPSNAWLAAFVEGSRHAGHHENVLSAPADMAWSDLGDPWPALVIGRQGRPFRARERHQLKALARIVRARRSRM